jgi:hypothetical protein
VGTRARISAAMTGGVTLARNAGVGTIRISATSRWTPVLASSAPAISRRVISG